MLIVLAVALGLGVIILFHEFGHFIVAKLVGLEVERFSIGFPPHVVKLRKGETEYCVGAIPLGGYVKVELGTSGEEVSTTPWYLRMLVVLAGPGANLLLTALLLFLVLGVVGREVSVLYPVVENPDNVLGLAPGDTVVSVEGRPADNYSDAIRSLQQHRSGTMVVGSEAGRREVSYSLSPDEVIPFEPLVPPVVGEAAVGTPAFEAGIRNGDSLVSVNGRPVKSWADLTALVQDSTLYPLNIAYVRDGKVHSAELTPIVVQGNRRIGVVARTRTRRMLFPLPRAAALGVEAALKGAAGYYRTLVGLFTRPRELVRMSGGPVYLAETLGQQAGLGVARLLETVAVISLAVLVFNLLPIPVLDGGQLIFLACEGVKGRPLSRRSVRIAQQAGIFVILVIFVLVVSKDISRLYTRVW
ncbi:RIP metalloprotease RseP [Candidatus Fermentibacteria bacterium]|nr:RIP metalloprotease RseP [Candidatus Fermentibacteria bacterium]